MSYISDRREPSTRHTEILKTCCTRIDGGASIRPALVVNAVGGSNVVETPERGTNKLCLQRDSEAASPCPDSCSTSVFDVCKCRVHIRNTETR